MRLLTEITLLSLATPIFGYSLSFYNGDNAFFNGTLTFSAIAKTSIQDTAQALLDGTIEEYVKDKAGLCDDIDNPSGYVTSSIFWNAAGDLTQEEWDWIPMPLYFKAFEGESCTGESYVSTEYVEEPEFLDTEASPDFQGTEASASGRHFKSYFIFWDPQELVEALASNPEAWLDGAKATAGGLWDTLNDMQDRLGDLFR